MTSDRPIHPLLLTLFGHQQMPVLLTILDADSCGPSTSTMRGMYEPPELGDEGMVPTEKYGLRVMSIGFLIDEE